MTESPTSTMASRSTDLVCRHQTATFVVLTLALSWGWWMLGTALLGTDELSRGLVIPGAFGPPVAAGLVTWMAGDSVRTWGRQALDWRVHPRWYLVAVGLPSVVVLAGVGGALALAGGPIDLSVLPQRLPLFALSFVIATLIGGGQEELGWRGFALPRLQERYGALTASLIVGVAWAVWHVPLFALDAPRNQTGNFLLYTVLVLGLSVLLTWQYNSTGGSVLLAMLLHGGINASGNFLPMPIAAAADWPLVTDAGMIVGVWAAALAVLVWSQPTTLSRHGLPDPPAAESQNS
jgi:membrane protease YdiL (CAAX protease family)